MSERRKRAKDNLLGSVNQEVSPEELDRSIYGFDMFKDVDRHLTTVQPDGSIQFGSFIMKREGLQLDGDISRDEWLEFGQRLNQLKDSIQWILGDWANLGLDHAADWVEDSDTEDNSPTGKYERLVQQTDYSYKSLSNFAAVSRRIPFPRRRGNLSYSHHAEVAYLDSEEKQDYYLDVAEQGDESGRLSVRKLRELIQGTPTLPASEQPLDKVISSAEKTYHNAKKQAERAKGGERMQWRTFAQQQAEKWRQLAEELD